MPQDAWLKPRPMAAMSQEKMLALRHDG